MIYSINDDFTKISELLRLKYKVVKENNFYILMICPFHNEKTPSFYIKYEQGFFKCFGCGISGNLNKLTKLLNINIRINTIQRNTIISNDIDIVILSLKKKIQEFLLRIFEIFKDNWNEKDSILELSKFMSDRKIHDKYKNFIISNLGIITPNSSGLFIEKLSRLLTLYSIDKNIVSKIGLIKKINDNYILFFNNHIIFPFYNTKGTLVGFGGKNIFIKKYINMSNNEIFSKSECFSTFSNFFNKKHNKVYIVEGYMDMLTYNLLGYSNSLSIAGNTISDIHLNYIKKFNLICLSLDYDESGIKQTLVSINKLLSIDFTNIYAVNYKRFNNLKDIDECRSILGENETVDMIENPVYFIEFIKTYFKIESINNKENFFKNVVESYNNFIDFKNLKYYTFLKIVRYLFSIYHYNFCNSDIDFINYIKTYDYYEKIILKHYKIDSKEDTIS